MHTLGGWANRLLDSITRAVSPGRQEGEAARARAALIAEGATWTTCRICDGSGLCRVCGGAGRVDRLVALAGGDPVAMSQEPVQQMRRVKCRACPSSKGACKTCEGKGKVLTLPTQQDSPPNSQADEAR